MRIFREKLKEHLAKTKDKRTPHEIVADYLAEFEPIAQDLYDKGLLNQEELNILKEESRKARMEKCLRENGFM